MGELAVLPRAAIGSSISSHRVEAGPLKELALVGFEVAFSSALSSTTFLGGGLRRVAGEDSLGRAVVNAAFVEIRSWGTTTTGRRIRTANFVWLRPGLVWVTGSRRPPFESRVGAELASGLGFTLFLSEDVFIESVIAGSFQLLGGSVGLSSDTQLGLRVKLDL